MKTDMRTKILSFVRVNFPIKTST